MTSLARLRRGRSRAPAPDTIRGERVTRALVLVERFVYDLGMLIAGQPVDDLGDYVAPPAAERLQLAAARAISSGAVIRPDFGEYAQVRMEGDLLDPTASLRAEVELDDRSARLHDDGSVIPRLRRRIRVLLLIDPGITQVLDHHLEIVA